jgi:hypothetical protein
LFKDNLAGLKLKTFKWVIAVAMGEGYRLWRTFGMFLLLSGDAEKQQET